MVNWYYCNFNNNAGLALDLRIKQNMELYDLKESISTITKHPKCQGYYDYFGDFECYYDTELICEDCKYSGLGDKDPEAK